MDLVLAVLIAFAAGGGAVFLALRRQVERAFERGKASTQAELAALVERLAARDRDIERLELASREAAQTARTRDEKIAAIMGENSGLKAELDAERASTREKLAVLNDAQEQLTTAFRGLSAQALKANNESFLDLAAQTLGKYQQGAQGELEKRQQAIQELVAPVKLSLDKLDGRIHDIEKLREGAYQALTTQVRSLSEAVVAPRALNLVVPPAGGTRPLGRAAAASRRRDGRDGRALRLHRAGERDRRRRQAAARRHRPSSGRPEHRGRREDTAVRLPRGRGDG
jgi:hypothetical protein